MGCKIISTISVACDFTTKFGGMWKLPLYLGFFEFVHNVRTRGKALLGALIELRVT
jgi:hypothetical protein